MRKELLNFVVVSNEFARYAEINLGCPEWKLLLYIISKIKKHEKLFLKEEITIKEVSEIFGISTYGIIRNSVKTLNNKKIMIKGQKTQIFNFIYVDKKNICYCFSKDMHKHLLDLEDNMTMFELGRIYNMNSKYTIRAYLFGMSFRFSTYYIASENTVQKIFGVKLIKSEFERRVFDSSLKEINDKTNMFLHQKFKEGL